MINKAVLLISLTMITVLDFSNGIVFQQVRFHFNTYIKLNIYLIQLNSNSLITIDCCMKKILQVPSVSVLEKIKT